jgi:hypothetical protein
MPHPHNPYQYGPPIKSETLFFGRTEELITARALLCVKAKAAGSISIWGPRWIGKSSLQIRIQREVLRERDDVLIVRIQAHRHAEPGAPNPYEDFRRKLYETAAEAGVECEPPGPQPGEDIVKLLIACAAAGRTVFLFVDHLDTLLTAPEAPLSASWLRSLGEHPDTRFGIVATMHVPITEVVRRTNGDSPFGNVVQEIALGPFARTDALRMVREPADAAGVSLPPNTEDLIYSACGGHPFFTNWAAFEIANAVLTDHPWPTGSAGLEDWLLPKTRDRLDELCGDLLEPPAVSRKLPRIVQKGFLEPYDQREPSAWVRALLRTGLCQPVEILSQLAPTGGLFRRYFQVRYDAVPTRERPASTADVENFATAAKTLERRLAELLLEACGGYPASVTRAAEASGGSVKRTGFGAWLQAFCEEPVLESVRVGRGILNACSGDFRTLTNELARMRNAAAHGYPIRIAELDGAWDTLREVNECLEDFQRAQPPTMKA